VEIFEMNKSSKHYRANSHTVKVLGIEYVSEISIFTVAS